MEKYKMESNYSWTRKLLELKRDSLERVSQLFGMNVVDLNVVDFQQFPSLYIQEASWTCSGKWYLSQIRPKCLKQYDVNGLKVTSKEALAEKED